MVYKETQSLKSTWFVPFFYGIQVLVFIFLLLKDLMGPIESISYFDYGVILTVSLLVGLLIVGMKLEIRMDFSGLSFKSPPFVNSWKKFKWEEIKDIQLIKNKSIWSGGGLGIHYNLKGEWNYIFSTQHAVRVSLKDSSFVWSTREPDKLLAAWREFKSER